MTPDQACEMLTTPHAPEEEQAVASAIRTGSLDLDRALALHGFPVGKISHVYGEALTGKTTLAYSTIAHAQDSGRTVALMDFHGHFSPDYAWAIGVNLEELLVLTPRYGVRDLRQWPADVLVFDGISDQYTADEINCLGWDRTILAVTQATYSFNSWGKVVTPTLEDAAVSVRLRPGKPILGGITVQANATLDKFAHPNAEGEAQFQVRYGQGIDYEDELIRLGLRYGLIEKTGNWFDLGIGFPVQGREAAKRELQFRPEFSKELEEQVRARLDAS